MLTLPIGAESRFSGVIDLLRMKALGPAGRAATSRPSSPTPRGDARQQLVETVAECDDALLEKYLEEGELADDEILRGLVAGTRARAITPLLCGSATLELGVAPLLWAVTELLPSAGRPRAPGRWPTAASGTVEATPEAPFSALVFKTMIDRYTGTLSVLRVVSGSLRPDSDAARTPRNGSKERIGKLHAAARRRARGRPRGRARATWWRWRSCEASTPATA